MADSLMDKVLVVEDELTLRETLAYSLTRQGYQVFTAADGRAGLDAARQHRPDAIVLDVMLPGLDGLEVCRILRQEMNVPILMLTARADEIDKIVGLEVGADDYMTKPFSMRELLARVKALLRRVRMVREDVKAEQPSPSSDAMPQGEVWTFGDLVVDLNRWEVRVRGQQVHIKPKEFDLLIFLVRNRGMVLSRDQLLERVWGWEYEGDSRTVSVHVRWLREKIEDDPANPVRLVTVRGVGYRFDG